MNRKQLVKDRCANYDIKTSHCLLTDKACPLVPFKYHGHTFPIDESAACDYFDKYILGLNKKDEATIDAEDTVTNPPVIERVTSKSAVIYSYRNCQLCGEQFKPNSSVSKYCCDACKRLVRKCINKKYYSHSKQAL